MNINIHRGYKMNINYMIRSVFGVVGICLLIGSIGFDSTGMVMGAIACALVANIIPNKERKVLPLPPLPTPVVEEPVVEEIKKEPEPKPEFKCETCDKKFDVESKLKKHIGMAHWKDIKV